MFYQKHPGMSNKTRGLDNALTRRRAAGILVLWQLGERLYVMEQGDERRGFVRVPFNTEVIVEGNGNTIQSREGINVSMSGIRLTTSAQIPSPGSSCQVRILLGASESRLPVEARGIVVRSEPGILAVQFTEIDLDCYHHLRQIILNNTDEPEKAEKEFSAHWGIRESPL